MVTTIKFRCPSCGSDRYEEALVTGHRAGDRVCLGLGNGLDCTFSWEIADDWRHFHIEVTFASPGAYQLALKAQQTINVLGLLAKQGTT